MIEYWEKYTGGPTKPPGERIHITINKKGLLMMNRNVHKLLSNAEAVELMFNRKDGVIGISPAHAQLSEAFPVVDKGGSFGINASPFCRHFGIKVQGTEAFVNPEIDDTGVLELNLATTVSIGHRKRREPKVSRPQAA
ncbi:MAG TPA: hypothetical protein PLP21_06335 [Pyrinomonadaceae bacterium]|nr:hypothetical protein [Acidobacteriota bacterium]HQZ95918.1 hypothetical protein [Pyrinomonadaceae bacterium]